MMCKLLTFQAANREMDTDIHGILIKKSILSVVVLIFEDFEAFVVHCRRIDEQLCLHPLEKECEGLLAFGEFSMGAFKLETRAAVI